MGRCILSGVKSAKPSQERTSEETRHVHFGETCEGAAPAYTTAPIFLLLLLFSSPLRQSERKHKQQHVGQDGQFEPLNPTVDPCADDTQVTVTNWINTTTRLSNRTTSKHFSNDYQDTSINFSPRPRCLLGVLSVVAPEEYHPALALNFLPAAAVAAAATTITTTTTTAAAATDATTTAGAILERYRVRADAVEEPAVVAHDENAASEAVDRLLEASKRVHIEIVGRF